MKRLLGLFLLALPFAAILAACFVQFGLYGVLWTVAGTAALIGCCFAGVTLIDR